MRLARLTALATLALTLIAAPLAVEAQQAGKKWRICFLNEGSDPSVGQVSSTFIPELHELGYVIGQNLTIEYRYAEGKVERLAALAAELVDLKPDAIAAVGTRDALALQTATTRIPIVMLFPGDPVGTGLVQSLASPGANITGTSLMYPDVAGKRLELLKEVVPKLQRIGILGNPRNAAAAADIRATEAAARSQGLQVQTVGADTLERLVDGMGEFLKEKPDGLLVIQDSLIATHPERIAEFALQNRLPAVFPSRFYVARGGLIGYGPDLRHVGRRAAGYVDKILRGAKPADLPVEQPTKFALVINLKTAKALGLTIPPAVLARADEIIQ
jgi:putative ABC transport system substrate-binding protein